MATSTSLRLFVLGVLASMVGCTEPAGLNPGTSSTRASQPAPEVRANYVRTPAGWYHRSCVHEIEEGALVEKDGLVRRRDGTTYQIPKCLYPVYGARIKPGV